MSQFYDKALIISILKYECFDETHYSLLDIVNSIKALDYLRMGYLYKKVLYFSTNLYSEGLALLKVNELLTNITIRNGEFCLTNNANISCVYYNDVIKIMVSNRIMTTLILDMESINEINVFYNTFIEKIKIDKNYYNDNERPMLIFNVLKLSIFFKHLESIKIVIKDDYKL